MDEGFVVDRRLDESGRPAKGEKPAAESRRHNYRADLTQTLIELIEQGAAPWQKPWDAQSAPLLLPFNPVTRKPYRGMNRITLMVKGTDASYEDPRWCTLRQANARSWRIKKGEKGSWVEYWEWAKWEEREDPETGEMVRELVPLERPRDFYAVVFNAAQIDGIPQWQPPQPIWKPHDAAALILTRSAARIVHDGGAALSSLKDEQARAFYDRLNDIIHLPPKAAFKSASDYYDTALHELGHWSGHESRLNRQFGSEFGDELYAREELRAEIASMFLSAEIGLPHNAQRHAAYVEHWVKILAQNKNEIFWAARDASKITDFVTAFAPEARISHGFDHDAGPEMGEVVEDEPDLTLNL